MTRKTWPKTNKTYLPHKLVVQKQCNLVGDKTPKDDVFSRFVFSSNLYWLSKYDDQNNIYLHRYYMYLLVNSRVNYDPFFPLLYSSSATTFGTWWWFDYDLIFDWVDFISGTNVNMLPAATTEVTFSVKKRYPTGKLKTNF